MRRLALIALLSTAGGSACTAPASAPASGGTSGGAARDTGAPRVDGATAHSLVKAGALLLDVRTEEEFADRHIEGARNIPVDRIEASVSSMPRDRPVVVYCASGGRATHAAQILHAAGIDARNLGPMSAWGRPSGSP